ncbi:hypothetical protein B0H11DRAFT_2250497 [Mycena galericulata]|nr:hypothetical protein B0H11DRAFT_2250497 [Mycena galericulata]
MSSTCTCLVSRERITCAPVSLGYAREQHDIIRHRLSRRAREGIGGDPHPRARAPAPPTSASTSATTLLHDMWAHDARARPVPLRTASYIWLAVPALMTVCDLRHVDWCSADTLSCSIACPVKPAPPRQYRVPMRRFACTLNPLQGST